MKKILISTAFSASLFLAANAQITMPKLFTDGMVLQQKTSVPVWGKASANEEVTVSNSWNSEEKKVKASQDGFWKVNITTPCYGGPFSLTVKGKNTVHINDVFIGEVWLASGQSNMEMPMEGWLPECPVENGPEDIANSFNNEIRVFMVERAVSFNEEKDLKGSWKIASPLNTPKFGATCYYFARKLNSELGVPVGIINTSWGGTPDESWIPQDFVKTLPEYTAKCTLIDNSRGKADEAKTWVLSHKSIDKPSTWENLELNDIALKDKTLDDSKWQTTTVGKLWETDDKIRTFDGVIWFRKTIEIPPSMEGKDLTISLGPIDDMDITYFNGEEIGRYMQDGFYNIDRVYTIDKKLVKAGKAVIAIRVLDTQGGGGIFGNPSKLKFYVKGDEKSAVKIDTQWKYMPVAEYFNGKFYLYDIQKQDFFQKPLLPIDLGEQTPTCLYNAMVAPIAGYKISGAIWYQGEANVGRAEEYSRSFPLMIKSWREKWSQGDFPFYFVQIAPWNYGEGQSQEIREAQRLTLEKVKNSGMVVTMDIGNNENIHPANKHEVGDRLAKIALNNVYGKKDVKFSGPMFKSQRIEGGKIVLSFDFSEGLTSKGGELDGFEICGKNKKYYPAKAVIKGNEIEVSSPEVKKPLSVRYLWKNCVDNHQLFNAAGLPSSSFQTTKCF